MNQPFVSVIIPTYNSERYVAKTIAALFNQNYPRDKFEMIIVDNGSLDETNKLLQSFNLTVYVNRSSKNPYISRNIGIEKGNGEILAFLDITCVPSENWLSEGVKLIHEGADMVGGQVQFSFSPKPVLSEWYDSITFVDVKNYIRKYGGTVSGNLFVRRRVVETVGPFPEYSRSGMDILWTRKATGSGFKLVYGPKVVVLYPARRLNGLVHKSYRIGKGHIISWRSEEKSKFYIWSNIFRTFAPPTFSDIRNRIKERGHVDMQKHLIQLWCINYICKIAMACGRLAAAIKNDVL